MPSKPSRVAYTKTAAKQSLKLPKHIRKSLLTWAMDVEKSGVREVRKIAGYHDEPLKGDRYGQRSVRLNALWRVIYTEDENEELTIVRVEEISPHRY